jgi:hypothetical protein
LRSTHTALVFVLKQERMRKKTPGAAVVARHNVSALMFCPTPLGYIGLCNTEIQLKFSFPKIGTFNFSMFFFVLLDFNFREKSLVLLLLFDLALTSHVHSKQALLKGGNTSESLRRVPSEVDQ